MNDNSNIKIESIGLAKCEFNEECDFCSDPQYGTYSRLTGYDSSEIAYYICGKCALEKIKSGVEHCSDIKQGSEKFI